MRKNIRRNTDLYHIGLLSGEPIIPYFCMMSKPGTDYTFWTKYKKFAGNEILLYVIMIAGIILGIIIVSYFRN
jgi:hypothetical protein